MPRRISLSEVGHRNVVYSDVEQTVIKNGLKTTEAGLLRLNTLRTALNGAARRSQLKDQIRRCKVALAPFKKIPKEIWMYIFELYSQSGQLSTRDAEHSPAIVLTLVCSAWRQIALLMPKLWSDVRLDDEDTKLARMWLERAGNIPRALLVETPRPRPLCSSSSPQTIQTFICSFPFRKLHLTQCEGIDFTSIPVESLLPLEDLALLRPAAVTRMPLTLSLSPHHFLHLVSLQIETEMMPHFHVSRPFATWKKLCVLRLKCELDKPKWLEILRDASSVEDCSLRLSGTSFYGQNPTIENTILANLKILRVSISYNSTFWSFVDHFTFPILHTLILTISRGFLYDFQASDKSSLLRLAPRIGSLRSLNFHRSFMNVDVGLVLECLPLLQVLELHCGKITTHTGEKIGRGELGSCLPELRDWSFSNLSGFLQACELRRDVMKHQFTISSGAIASLEKVSVKACHITCKLRRRINKLRKAGVQFELF